MRTRQKAKLEAASLGSEKELEPEEAEKGYIALDNVTGDECPPAESQSDDPTDPPTQQGAAKKQPGQVISLSSSLDPGPAPELYFSCDPDKMLQGLLGPRASIEQRGQQRDHEPVMKDCVITADFEKLECAPPMTVSKYTRKKMAKV